MSYDVNSGIHANIRDLISRDVLLESLAEGFPSSRDTSLARDQEYRLYLRIDAAVCGAASIARPPMDRFNLRGVSTKQLF